MKSIDEDIKEGRFKNIYFLIGVERYLISQYRDKLVKALAGEDDGINCKFYTGVMPDVNELIGFLDTVPCSDEPFLHKVVDGHFRFSIILDDL